MWIEKNLWLNLNQITAITLIEEYVIANTKEIVPVWVIVARGKCNTEIFRSKNKEECEMRMISLRNMLPDTICT